MNTLERSGSMNKLYDTLDYDIFKFREDNRELDPNHVERVKFSLMKFNDLHLNPITVNDDMEVVNGQHRLAAAKALGLRVYYLVDHDYDPEKMIVLNTVQKNWVMEDYLNYWISHGRTDYQNLKDFVDDIGFPLAVMITWLAHHGGTNYKDFRTGNFKFEVKENVLVSIFMAKKLFDKMKERNYKPIKIYKQHQFHVAMRKFFLNPLVDVGRFFDRFEAIPFQIRYTFSWSDYLDQFIEIYNYDMRKDRLKVISDGDKREIIG